HDWLGGDPTRWFRAQALWFCRRVRRRPFFTSWSLPARRGARLRAEREAGWGPFVFFVTPPPRLARTLPPLGRDLATQEAGTAAPSPLPTFSDRCASTSARQR